MTPEKFKALPKAKRRILIAKDVILQINAEKFIPGTGYSNFSSLVYGDEDAREAIKNNKLQCVGCAKGGIFYSCIALKNTLTVSDARYASLASGNKFLLEDFTQHQLNMIEAAYEAHTMYLRVGKESKKCVDFGSKYAIRKNRLIAIMKNIIKNKGTFKP